MLRLNDYLRKRRLSNTKNGSHESSVIDAGFTLLELIIVVLIVGLLAAISIPIFSNQQRASIEATVKSDVKSSSSVMAPGANGHLYASKAVFMGDAANNIQGRSASSGENVMDYFVNDAGTVACVQSSRTFSESDITSYHFLTSVGYLQEGVCPDLGSAVVPDPGDPVHNGDGDTGTTPATDEITQMGGLTFTTTYSPQTNSLNFCYKIVIAIDPNYAHTMSPPYYSDWQYKIDRNAPPFWGLNPNTNLNSTYGYTTMGVEGAVWTMHGEGWNNWVDNGHPRTVGFCTTSVPEPPLNPATYSYVITPSSSNSIWWACVDFVVTSDLWYPTPWKIQIDLNSYFTSIAGKTPSFVNLSATNLGSNVYEVTGIGWNHYVANLPGMQRNYATAICYNPAGQPW